MIIQLLNGKRFDIADFGLKRLFHHIPSAEIIHSTAEIDGRSDIIVDTKLGNRTISVEMLYQVYDIRDYYLLRDELNALFVRREPFYIIFKREPYKRWKVRLATQFEIEPNANMNSFVVEFLTEDVYAESVGTSLQLAEQNFDSGLWGFASKVDVNKQYQYRFTSNSFSVENIGDAVIDPCEHELEIIVKATASSYLQIRNNTTGETFRYNGQLKATDELKITGIRVLKNNVSSFGNVNGGQLLSLSPEINSITITGGTVYSIVFNFRFLYK